MDRIIGRGQAGIPGGDNNTPETPHTDVFEGVPLRYSSAAPDGSRFVAIGEWQIHLKEGVRIGNNVRFGQGGKPVPVRVDGTKLWIKDQLVVFRK